MAMNKLQARLEVIGGEKLVRTFREIGASAAHSFDRIDREADQAARRVRALEAELLRLKAVASNIRAKITIDEEKGPTTAQKEALKLADELDRRAVAINTQIGDIQDGLLRGRGQAFEAMARDLDRDRLESIRAVDAINDKLDDLRKRKDAGESIISDKDFKDLERAADRMEAVSDNWLASNRTRLSAVEKLEAKAARKREADAERFRKAQEDKAEKAWQDEEDRIQAASKARREAEEKSLADFERAREASRRSAYTAWWKDTLDRADKEAQLAESAQLARKQAADDEQRRIERQRKALAQLAADWRNIAEARKAGGLAELEVNEELARRRQRERDELSARIGLPRAAPAPVGNVGTLLSQKDLFTPEQAERIRKFDERVRGVHTRLGAFVNSRALKTVRDDADAVGNSMERAGRKAVSSKLFSGDLTRGLRDISRGMGQAYTKTTQFLQAYRQVELAVGNAAVRTGVAGLVGGLGLGIGALGGAVVGGGIMAAGGLAAFDGAALQRTAQMLGVTTKEFSEMRYAADKVGVGVDAFAGSLSGLRAKMAEVAAAGDDVDPFLKSLEDGTNQYKVKLKLVTRTAAKLTLEQQRAKAIWDKNEPELNPDGTEKQLSRSEQEAKKKRDEANEALYKEKVAARDTKQVFMELFDLFARVPDGEWKVELAERLGVTDLLPLLNRGRAEVEQMFADAERLGVSVGDAHASKMQETREQLYDAWAAIIGLGYQLAIDMAPHIERLMGFIVSWISSNRNEISTFLTETYEWVANAFADFIRLFKQGADAPTYFEWTKTLYNGLVAIKDGAVLMWDAIVAGWKHAKPVFDSIGEAMGLGPDSGLQVALGYLIANILGVVSLGIRLATSLTTAFRLFAAAILSFAMPVLTLVTTALAAIVGWPLLLLGGVGLVAAYWDDIAALFSRAWELFKQTFPETAAVLEQSFLKAVEPVQWLIDLISSILAPVKMVFDAIAEVFNFFTGFDITGTGLMIGLAALLTLVVKITTAVRTLMAALGLGAAASAAGAAAGGAGALAGIGGGLMAALAALVSPAGLIALTVAGLGVMTHAFLEAVDAAEELGKQVASMKAADEAFMRGKEANGGVNPGGLNANLPAAQKQWQDFLRRAAGGPNIDVWRDGSFERFFDRLDAVKMPENFSFRNVTFDRPDNGAAMTARPIVIPLWGGGSITAYSYDQNIESKIHAAKRATISSSPGWQRR